LLLENLKTLLVTFRVSPVISFNFYHKITYYVYYYAVTMLTPNCSICLSQLQKYAEIKKLSDLTHDYFFVFHLFMFAVYEYFVKNPIIMLIFVLEYIHYITNLFGFEILITVFMKAVAWSYM